jgi:deazaflavin-dependent oxidoreductase (nitroreductase family)
MARSHYTLPRALARFNKRITNRIQGQWAWLLPPYAVIIHTGRKSGRTYRTPVVASVADQQLLIGIMYGKQSDWVRNLLAAGRGEFVRRGRTYELLDPKVVEESDAEYSDAHGAGRLLGGFSGKALAARIGEQLPDRTRRGFPA